MIRQDSTRIAAKRRAVLDHRKKQFEAARFQEVGYANRLNFYEVPPTGDVTLEEFEGWGVDRLRGMSSQFHWIHGAGREANCGL
jgi:DNA primase large subunit